MDTGLFDPLENQTFTKIGFDAINSNAAQFKNLEAARQGMVLLQNPATATTTATTATTTSSASSSSLSSLSSSSSSSSAAAAAAAAAATPILPLVPGVEAGGIVLLGPHARTQKTLAGRKKKRRGVERDRREKREGYALFIYGVRIKLNCWSLSCYMCSVSHFVDVFLTIV